MSVLQSIRAALPTAKRRPIEDIRQEVEDELAFHLEMRTEENISLGMSIADAQAAALERFGDFDAIRRSCHTIAFGGRMMFQRLQGALIGILLIVVSALGYEMYCAQQAMAEANNELAQAKRAAAAAQPREYSVATLPAAVIKTVPQAGDTQVDPNITEVQVIYSKKMLDKSWSWGQISDETMPKTTGQPRYLADGKTCVLPVKLEPGRTYVLQLNSLTGKFANFKDTGKRPAVPYLLVFETKK